MASPSHPLCCDSFSDFPCSRWPWQFWEIPVRYFVEWPLTGIGLMVFSGSTRLPFSHVVCACKPACVHASISNYLSVCLSIHLSIYHLAIYRSISRSFYLPTYLSVYISFIYISIYTFTSICHLPFSVIYLCVSTNHIYLCWLSIIYIYLCISLSVCLYSIFFYLCLYIYLYLSFVYLSLLCTSMYQPCISINYPLSICLSSINHLSFPLTTPSNSEKLGFHHPPSIFW